MTTDEDQAVLPERPPIDAEAVPDYCYRAQVTNVVDGDTLDARIDLGFETHIIERVRIAGIDTSEISFVPHDSEEYEQGMDHKGFLESWIAHAEQCCESEWPFVLLSEQYGRGAYGRVLGDLQSRADGEWYAQAVYDEYEAVELYD